MKKTFVLLLLSLLLTALASSALSQGSTTVMVYMLASNLESDSGSATGDINEMLYANLGEDVRVLMCAGGTKKWHNSVMNANTNAYYSLSQSGLELLKDAGKKDMTDPDTLSSFIRFGAEQAPADHYILILWDHGAGPIYGFGVDERFSEENTMSLPQMRDALEAGGVHFDIVGFDACLMGSVEVAIAMAPHADYMIASEETEPGTGWYYTNWLSQLGTLDSEAIGRLIIDDYFKTGLNADSGDTLTLSMIRLDALQGSALEGLWQLSKDMLTKIQADQYASISHARSNARSFGAGDFDMVDLLDLVTNLGLASGEQIIEDVTDAVVYTRATRNMSGASGLSIYFPDKWLDDLDNMVDVYETLDGWDSVYVDLVKTYASVAVGGQSAATSSSSFGSDSVGSANSPEAFGSNVQAFDFQSASWFQSDTAASYSDYYQENTLGSGELIINLKNDDYYALHLSDSDWALINDIQCQVLLDDEEGYIDLGSDDVYAFDEDGDLIVDFDYTWVTLNGCTVAYYAESYLEDGDYFCYIGYSPALLNEQEVELVLCWDSEHEGGYVRGARLSRHQNNLFSRGLIAIEEGDVIVPLCDYYLYDGSFDDTYLLGDGFTVRGDIEVTYEDIGDDDTAISYMLVDIYGGRYYTEMLYYE